MFINNLILIKGDTYSQIKRLLQQWAELYANDISFEFYRLKDDSFAIKADDKLDNDRFNCLINYFDYPENDDYELDIKGYTTALNINGLCDVEDLRGKKLMIYLSEEDTEFDNVYAVTESNENYKIDFIGTITYVDSIMTYQCPDVDLTSLPEIIHFTNIEKP